MTITEFLEARIAEDEAQAKESQHYEDDIWETAGWWNPTRVLAECAAKRKLIAISEEVERMDYQITQEWGGSGEAIDGTADDMLKAMASVYADHPDYQQEWAA